MTNEMKIAVQAAEANEAARIARKQAEQNELTAAWKAAGFYK